MERVVVRSSRIQYLALLALSLCFVATGALMAVTANVSGAVVGWLSIVFFGGCAIVFARQLVESRPRLVIDDRGILDRTLKVGVIEWQDIVDASVGRIHGNAFVCLSLRDPAKYLQRLSPLGRRVAQVNRRLGFTELSLNLTGTDLNAEQLCELIIKETASRESRHPGLGP